VSPNPVTNRDFNKILSRILAKPAFLRLPGLAARIILGEMAKEALLASARAIPAKLIKSKYKFQFPDLEGALRHVLRKPEKAN
jgi:NAD dependent epimerase/dehydratase family enzyme